jgi:broad specificity phosphatase PhoE
MQGLTGAVKRSGGLPPAKRRLRCRLYGGGTMPRLILVKHSSPKVNPDVPAAQWSLSPEGEARCAALAEAMRAYRPAAIVSSEETKALQTARAVAGALGLDCSTAPDLHEHDRSNVPMMDTREFLSSMALVFKRPDEVALGRESANGACDRFERAVRSIAAQHADGDVLIVSHGTVISLLVSRHNRIDGYQLWRAMGLPSYVVLDAAELSLIHRADRVA